MASNFCTNCGKPLKPNAKFCGSCGAKLVDTNEPTTNANNTTNANTQNTINNTVNDIKQKAASIVNEGTINNVKQKASTIINEKNINEVKQKIKDTNLNDVKEKATTFIHEANVNEMKEQATANVKKLPNWLKIVAVVLIVALVGYGGYYYFSPQKQVQKVAESYAEQTVSIFSTNPSDISDRDINNLAKLYAPDKQQQVVRALPQLRKELASRGHYDDKPTYDIMSVSLIDDNKAIVKIIFNTDEKIDALLSKSTYVYLTKIDGKWYINDIKRMNND